MAENDLVGDQTQAGADGNQPSVSGGNGQPITPAATPQNFVSRKDFENVVSELRGLQSRQDKTQTEQTRFMDELKKQMAKGKTLDEAEIIVNEQKAARDKDDLLLRIAEKVGVSTSSSQQATAGNGSPVTADTARIIAEYQLDGNDPQVVAQVLKAGTPAEAELAALKIAFRRSTSQPPSPAAAPTLTGAAPQPAGEAELLKTYQKEMIAAQGRPDEARAVRNRYIQMGVDVGKVAFT